MLMKTFSLFPTASKVNKQFGPQLCKHMLMPKPIS